MHRLSRFNSQDIIWLNEVSDYIYVSQQYDYVCGGLNIYEEYNEKLLSKESNKVFRNLIKNKYAFNYKCIKEYRNKLLVCLQIKHYADIDEIILKCKDPPFIPCPLSHMRVFNYCYDYKYIYWCRICKERYKIRGTKMKQYCVEGKDAFIHLCPFCYCKYEKEIISEINADKFEAFCSKMSLQQQNVFKDIWESKIIPLINDDEFKAKLFGLVHDRITFHQYKIKMLISGDVE